MKKFLAVFMAFLMALSVFTVAVMADDEVVNEEHSTTTIEIEITENPNEPTTRNIVSDNGLVVPINFKQLKMSVIFKLVEKVLKFIFGLFGGDIDDNLASEVSSIGGEVQSAIEEGSEFLSTNGAG
ncbi:MAG: hypothetical protein IJK89_01765 [Clostridia bacterium]|nr:hypothetical protein [Clostridia bacterium]